MTKNRESVDVVFIVLVYKNGNDIPGFVNSLVQKVDCSYRIIVVNSYCDETSEYTIKKIALECGCCFLSVPNKGYGAGNNRGIEFADLYFDYDFLIICNADIQIEAFSLDALHRNQMCVIAPMIYTIKGKAQNPYWYRPIPLLLDLIYKGFKQNIPFFLLIGFAFNRLHRELFLMRFRGSSIIQKQVYAAHGSFVIYSHRVLEKLGLPYDEKMFLYSEEAYVAHKLAQHGISTMLVKDCVIKHFEDGCSTGAGVDVNKYERASYIYYYESCILKQVE